MAKIAVTISGAQLPARDDVRAYEEGYRRNPEQERTLDAYARAAAEVLGREDWT